MKKPSNIKIFILVLLPFLVVVFLYEILPLVMMVFSSFNSESDSSILFTLENYITAFTRLSYQRAIVNSLKITLISTLIGIGIGFLGAQSAHSARGVLKNFFMTILNMTSNFAGVAA